MNTHFVLRKNYVDKNGLQQIQLIYCANSKQGRLDTGIRIRPKDWNTSKEQILSSVSEIKEDSKALNAQLTEKQAKVLTIVNDYKRINENERSVSPDPDPRYVRERFYEVKKEIKAERPLVDHLRSYIDEREKSMDIVYSGLKKDKRSGQYKTLSHDEILYNDLVRFSEKTRRTYYFRDVDKKFKTELVNFYLDKGAKKGNRRGLSNSTLKKKIARLKSFLRVMTEEGVNKKLDYQSFSMSEFKEANTDDNIYALTIEEFKKFINVPLKLPELELVRDYYILSCSCGLRWSDVSRLNKSKIKNGRIITTIVKSSKSVTIPLNKVSSYILKKYDCQLPKISKPQLDSRLKLMCRGHYLATYYLLMCNVICNNHSSD